MARSVYFVGSVPLENEEEVFRSLGATVGSTAPLYPDGETGREIWLGWQQGVFRNHPQLEVVGQSSENAQITREAVGDQVGGEGPARDSLQDMTKLRLKRGVTPDELVIPPFGYAEHALKSYATFARLKKEGKVPADVRFMVAIPPPLALISLRVSPEDQAAVVPGVERTLLAEVDEITAQIPHDQLAIQWDICIELLAAEGAFKLFYKDVIAETALAVSRLDAHVPAGVQLAYHLCYGNPGNKHILEPKDLGMTVAFVNAIVAASPREVDWVHMAVPIERNDEAYFSPLAQLKVPAHAKVVLGLVHEGDGVEGARARIRAASKYLPSFAVATECGLGRRARESIPSLLHLHREIAEIPA